MELHATTIVSVRRGNQVALAGDGQVTMGESMVMKHTARKLRRLYNGRVIAGFAGTTADAFTLFERFEAKLGECSGNLIRSAVELTKDWRKDKYLQKLEALLLVADADHTLILTGNGDVIEPDDGVAAIGSGGPYALSAARALLKHTDMAPDAIAREAMAIAGEICVFTNDHVSMETIGIPEAPAVLQA